MKFENGYVALFVTCVVMIFVVGFVNWSIMYSKGYQAADKDHQSAYSTHQTAEESYEKCAAELTIEDALGCYKDAYNTDREQERAESDLDAQREMANWAEGMLWATLLIGTIAAATTAVGVWYVAKTLAATSDAVKVANVSNQIMRQEQRPWLIPDARPSKWGPNQMEDGSVKGRVHFDFENTGKTVAIDVRVGAEIVPNRSLLRKSEVLAVMSRIKLSEEYEAPIFPTRKTTTSIREAKFIANSKNLQESTLVVVAKYRSAVDPEIERNIAFQFIVVLGGDDAEGYRGKMIVGKLGNAIIT